MVAIANAHSDSCPVERYGTARSHSTSRLGNHSWFGAALAPRSAFVRHRPGRYRLAAIDERYQFMHDAPIACSVITPGMVAVHNAASRRLPQR
jgi:hypothetical protein